jgi:hypothetical protein
MKIMFWNIFKLGSGKLKKAMSQVPIAANGMGNTVEDYITKIALGDAVWSAAGSATPVDALVIIELVSGGGSKGQPGTGSCLRTLNALKGAMNTAATAKKLSPMPTYDFVSPNITGRRETVGILYNTKALTLSGSAVAMRDTSSNFLSDRTPLWAKFNLVSGNTVLNLIGIHGPTSQPSASDYTKAVAFTNRLGDVAQIAQSGFKPVQATLIGGDYNCDGKNTYNSGNGNKRVLRTAFNVLTTTCKYSVPLASGTKTSLLRNADQSTTPPGYLSQPYDNIVCILPGQTTMPPVKVVDLCAGAPIWTTNGVAVFNAARKTSDHLPVTIEW